MRKALLPAGLLLCCASAFAQPDKEMADLASKKKMEDGKTKGTWTKGGILAINFAQQNSSNWPGTTEKYSIALGASADVFANRKWGKTMKNTWDNTLRMNYAFINNQSQGVRKTNDLIDLYSKYGYLLGKKEKWAAAFIVNARTQFTDGYDYSETPKRRTSGFFAPATVVVSPGFEWRPCKDFSLFYSPVSARWIIVSNKPYSFNYQGGVKPDGTQEQPIALLYGVDPGRQVDIQFGSFLTASYTKEIMKNVAYSSRLDLYSNYLSSSPLNIDVFWTNNLVLKVNKWLAVTYAWNVAYDDDYRPKGKPVTQFFSNLGVGISGKF